MLLTALVATVLCCPPARARAGQRDMLSVAVREANFRAGPSKRHEVLFTAIEHYPVRVTKRAGGWVRVVDFEGDRAWIARRLLERAPAVIVKVPRANLRERPTTKSAVVDKVERAQVFEVATRKGKWLALTAEGERRGWIREDLVWGAKDVTRKSNPRRKVRTHPKLAPKAPHPKTAAPRR